MSASRPPPAWPASTPGRCGRSWPSWPGASLLTEHRPGRFVLHDLLRAYAAECSHIDDTEAERQDAMRRALDHYLHTGVPASMILSPTRARIDVPAPADGVSPEALTGLHDATEWFATERPVVLAAIRHAAQHGFDAHCWRLEWTIGEFLDRYAHWHDYAEACATALGAARRLGSPAVEAIVLRGCARASTRLEAHADADAHLERARPMSTRPRSRLRRAARREPARPEPGTGCRAFSGSDPPE